MISEILAGSAFAKSAKVAIPAATKVSAIFGPIPSIFFKSSALAVAFLAVAFGAAFFASFFGAALAPEALIPSIKISVKACL